MKMMAVVMVVLGVGCSETEPIGPDPAGGTGASTADGGSGGDGTGAAGGSGGSGGQAQGSGFESGSRVKARTYVGDDGSRTPVGMYDDQLGVECSWRKAADGVTRCLPVAPTTPLFIDSACATPVLVGSCFPSTQYALRVDQGCDSVAHVHPIVGNTGPVSVWTHDENGACVTVPIPPGAVFTLGAEVPASQFVAATLATE